MCSMLASCEKHETYLKKKEEEKNRSYKVVSGVEGLGFGNFLE
jgi:hypothetical protein